MKFRTWIAVVLSCTILFSLLAPTVAATNQKELPKIQGDTIVETVDYPDGVEIVSIPTCENGLLTLTVDGEVRNLEPGIYEGHVVLAVTDDVVVEYHAGNLTHHFRQAIYGNEYGILPGKSVASAAEGVGISVDGKNIFGGDIRIAGDEFNGIYITGGDHTIRDIRISSVSDGIGDNDFAGYGAAVMATGEGTRMVLDNVDVSTQGVVHSALIAGGGANVVVKNSRLSAREGTLPSDYVFTTSLGFMKSVPWMLGLNGNCRATNMIGSNTRETFVNSTVSSEGWGVLSVDDCSNVTLTGINSTVEITGESGYGSYVIGGAVDQFYGSTIEVPDYAAILTTSGSVIYDDSTPENVASLNQELELGLTEEELSMLPEQPTVIRTGRASIMFHGMEASGDGLSANVRGGTQIYSDEAVFLSRGAAAYINVDGAEGASIQSGNGIITQMVDLDKAVRVMNADNLSTYPGPWRQFYDDYESIEKNELFDVTQQSYADVVNNFSNITMTGDLYNATTGKILDMGGNAQDRGQNMVVNLDNTTLNGVISASFAQREKSELYPEDYKQIGAVENIPCPAVNNGVIVSLKNGSVWNVSGDCYLTSLTVEEGSEIVGDVILEGKTLTVAPGETYTGNILVSGKIAPETMETEKIEESTAEPPVPSEVVTESAPPEPVGDTEDAIVGGEDETDSATFPVVPVVICVVAIIVVAACAAISVKKKKK